MTVRQKSHFAASLTKDEYPKIGKLPIHTALLVFRSLINHLLSSATTW